MLAALEQGVKACPRAGRRPDLWGGKWYSLIDKLYPEDTLGRAFAQVAANRGAAGVDRVTVAHYASTLDANLQQLSEEPWTGRYRPQAIRRRWIPKPGSTEQRPLGIPTVRDRVVQTALRMAMGVRLVRYWSSWRCSSSMER
jgi:RNA-directed DNA polymerase